MRQDVSPVPYEEIRNQRLQENKKRMQELGLSELSKSLSKSIHPTATGRIVKSRPPKEIVIDARRSSRIATCPQPDFHARRSSRIAACPQPDYREDSFELPLARRSYSSSSRLPTKYASDVERIEAINKAERILEELKTHNPCFVKSLLQSHVSSCFWLGLPYRFCKNHLPKKDEMIVLEDENGGAWETVYLAHRTGLSGGWRGFSTGHGLEDGDAIVFELIEPHTFKVHIVKASEVDVDWKAEKHGSQAIVAEQQGKNTQKEADKKLSRKVKNEIMVSKKDNGRGHKRKPG